MQRQRETKQLAKDFVQELIDRVCVQVKEDSDDGVDPVQEGSVDERFDLPPTQKIADLEQIFKPKETTLKAPILAKRESAPEDKKVVTSRAP